MPILTAEQIRSQKQLTRELVDVPEWGGEVFVRVMTGRERDEFEVSCGKDEQGTDNFRARLAASCLVDEEGRRLFTLAEAEELGDLSGTALDRVFQVARKLNPLTRADVEELEKNSASGPNGFSGSSFPTATSAP